MSRPSFLTNLGSTLQASGKNLQDLASKTFAKGQQGAAPSTAPGGAPDPGPSQQPGSQRPPGRAKAYRAFAMGPSAPPSPSPGCVSHVSFQPLHTRLAQQAHEESTKQQWVAHRVLLPLQQATTVAGRLAAMTGLGGRHPTPSACRSPLQETRKRSSCGSRWCSCRSRTACSNPSSRYVPRHLHAWQHAWCVCCALSPACSVAW